MRRLIFILSILMALSSCENEQEAAPATVVLPTAQDSIKSYKGSFIAAGNAAVLKGSQFIFQVKMDSVALQFKDSLKNYTSESESVIPVEVRGKVTDNPSPVGYSQIIEIKEVVEIFAKRRSTNTNKEK